jgi:quinoprotein glucose dehydrogenase
VPVRSDDAAKTALAPVLDKLLSTAPDNVRLAALNAGIVLGVNTTPLYDLAANEKNPAGLRAAAIAAMAEKKDKKLADAAKLGMASKDAILRIAAIRVQPRVPEGMKTLAEVLANGTPREQQAAVQTAAELMAGKDKTKSKEGESLLQSAMGLLEKGTLPVEAQLDLLDAAAKKKSGKLADRRKAYEAARKAKLAADPLAENRETLAGGDAERGGMIFRDRADVSCMRCHSINKVGGNAGPDLAGVLTRNGGGDKGREYILESILYPSKKIAQGFETIALHTNDGDVVAGLFKAEDDKEVTLDVPNVGLTKVAKSNIKSRQGGLSAMPDDISKTLSKQDLRDLVEFLSGQ